MAIVGFFGEDRFLSNFYLTNVEYHGNVYPSAEHAYQASKTDIRIEKSKIRSAPTPAYARKLGKICTIRNNWKQLQIPTMRNIVMHKFIQNEIIKEKLLKTGEQTLVEDNWWGDYFWGQCRCVGENHLGIILMDTRRVLRNTRVYKRKRS